MPKLDPTQITDKLIKNAQNSKDAYKFGIDNPDRDPKQAALDAEEKMKDKWNKAIDDGSWANGVSNYDLNEARRVAKEVGADNLAKGVAARRSKIAKFWQGWTPLLQTIKADVAAMPQDTEEQRKDRMLSNLAKLKAQKGKWR